MPFSTSQTAVAEMFQAAFNRAPGTLAALDGWAARYDANISAGKTAEESQLTILTEMMENPSFNSESVAVYGGLTPLATAQALFSASLGRALSGTTAETIWSDYFSTNGLAKTASVLLSTARINTTDKATLDAKVALVDAAIGPASTTTTAIFTLTSAVDVASAVENEAITLAGVATVVDSIF